MMRLWRGRRRRRAQDPELATSAQMRRALRQVLAGDLAGAETALAEAARIDSSSSDVYMALANVYRARGDISRAIQIHQNLLLRPDLPQELRHEALMGLALDFRAGGFLNRASASFEELLEVEPRNLQALRELERIRVESGDWERAIQTRRKIGSRDPETSRILAHLWTGWGRMQAGQGAEGEARKAFKRALSHDRSCAEAHIELGEQHLRDHKPKRAIECFRHTLDLNPSIGRLIYPKLWAAHDKAGDLQGFEALLRGRLALDSEDREVRLWLARVLIELGRREDASVLLRRLLDRHPESLSAHAELARALLGEHRQADALKVFEELLVHLPSDQPKLQCSDCGTLTAELHWRCPQCGAWDSIA